MTDTQTIPGTTARVWADRRVVGSTVAALTVIGGFLRLFELGLIEFRWDSAFWAVEALRVLREGNLPLVGPPVGSMVVEMYNGPALTYLTAFVFRVFGEDPRGVAAFIGLINTLCIPLTFWLGKKLYNARVGLLAALFFTFAPWLVLYGRMLWPPSPLPLVVLIILASLAWGVKRGGIWAFGVCGLLAGLAVQLHLSALALCASAFIVTLIYARRRVLSTALLIAGTVLGYSPVLVYDAQHNFPTLNALLRLQELRTLGDPFPVHAAKTIWNFENVMSGQALWVSKLSKTQYLPGALDWAQGILFTLLFLVALGAVLGYALHVWRKAPAGKFGLRPLATLPFADMMLTLFVVLPILYLLVSRSLIQRHYFIFFYPTVFLLIARGLDLVTSRASETPRLKFVPVALVALVALVVGLNIVTDFFMFRFLASSGGEGEYGTVLEDKVRAVDFIRDDSNQQFRVQLQDTHEAFPYRFLFEARQPILVKGQAEYPTALASDTAQEQKQYRIVETGYHPLQLADGERVLFESRGVHVVGSGQ